jgi:hypothetical protein
MDSSDPAIRFFWALAGAVGGAVTALGVQPWQKMRASEIAMAMFTSLTFALFAVPWLVEHIWGYRSDGVTAAGATTYLGALVAHVTVPRLLNLASTFFARITLGKDGEAER